MSEHANKVRDTLTAVEWCGEFSDCPSCGCGGTPPTGIHAADCKLVAAIDALVAERDEAVAAQAEKIVKWNADTLARALAAEARVAALEEALREWDTLYPSHRGECLYLTVGADTCTCGLDEVRRLTRAALAAPTKEDA